MKLIKKTLGIMLAILLVLLLLQFMAVNSQSVVLMTILGLLPPMSIGQAVLGSWLLGILMGVCIMLSRTRWRRWRRKIL